MSYASGDILLAIVVLSLMVVASAGLTTALVALATASKRRRH